MKGRNIDAEVQRELRALAAQIGALECITAGLLFVVAAGSPDGRERASAGLELAASLADMLAEKTGGRASVEIHAARIRDIIEEHRARLNAQLNSVGVAPTDTA